MLSDDIRNTELSGIRLRKPHFAPRAKRVIYIFQAGGPAQMELYDYKPQLAHLHGKESAAVGARNPTANGFTSGQGEYPVVASHLQVQPGTANAEPG